MKKLTATVALLGLFILPACAGIQARDEVLLPAMAVAFEGVSRDVERGIELMADPTAADAARAELERIRDALEARDRTALTRTDWGGLQTLALSGIQHRLSAGDIGPGVAASLVERISRFNEAWLKATDR